MNAVELTGCRPQPLLSYLKALGAFRLVVDQVDREIRGSWSPRGFRLESDLDREDLEEFFLSEYVPTPIVAPWNGRSGFFLTKDRSSEQLLTSVRKMEDHRLAPLQAAIEIGLELHEIADAQGWDAKKDKGRWVEYCRNRMPESAVQWLDSVAVLAEEGPVFPLVMGGSGGVLGSMDLSNNWLKHLVTVLGLENGDEGRERSQRLLGDALIGTATESAEKAPIGQFDPGRAGGMNLERARDKGTGARWVNPWDFVLALEGAPLLAAGVARRSGSQGGRSVAAMPFTVRSSRIGHSDAADNESASGELWLPLWSEMATLEEVRRIFSEARVQWDGRQAATGLDFVQAVANLGADRGIDAFERYDIVERLGRSSLAVPAGRFKVTDRPEVGVLAPVDRWVDSVARGSPLPTGVAEALRAVRAVQFDVATHGGPDRLWTLLGGVAELQKRVSRSGSTRARVNPMPGLDPDRWLPLLRVDGEEPEFAVAVGIASLRDRRVASVDGGRRRHTLASYLLPAEGPDHRRVWTNRSPLVEGLGTRPLVAVLSDVLGRRSQEEGPAVEHEARIEVLGAEPWFRFGVNVQMPHVEAFAAGSLDDRRVEEMLESLLLLGWEGDERRTVEGDSVGSTLRPVPLWRLLAPFYSSQAVGHRDDAGRWRDAVRLRPETGWARQLAAGNVHTVARAALQRLRVAGLAPLPEDGRALATGVVGRRLAAALLPRLPVGDTCALMDGMTANLHEVVEEETKEIS